uniref:F-box/LRR-repeat protein 15-like leucin rich repeat domain-containing protein n=1 Tax=Sinocyclocheilus rhinocerous TaxID=307959 RepID=A0A673LF04_9TELE
MKMILEGCSSLLQLNLAFTHITNATIRVLSSCCLTLRSRSLTYCTSFSDKGLQYRSTGKGCHRLTYLDLSGCSQISVDGFTYVAEACSSLQQIVLDDLPTMTDTCVQVLMSKCRVLTAIFLLDSPYLSDVAFKAMAEVISLTKIQIEVLYLCNNRMMDSSLKALCRSSLKLSEVQMSDCTRLTDASLKSLGSLTKLCNLNISGCRLDVLPNSLTRLWRWLMVEKLTFISRATALVDIPAVSMPIARSLKTYTAVKYLTRVGHFPKELDVSGCPLLTDRTPSFLLCSCPQLWFISMLYCKNISKQAALKLQHCVQHWKHSDDDAPYSQD